MVCRIINNSSIKKREIILINFKPQAVFFDLDGTLLNTLTDIAISMNQVLIVNNYPTHEINKYKYFVGDGSLELAKRVLPTNTNEEIIFKIQREYIKEYEQRDDISTALYNGIDELLFFLNKQKIPVIIFSNKDHNLVVECHKKFLSRFKIDAVFGVINNGEKKPNPIQIVDYCKKNSLDPTKCLYFGDTNTDMQTAQNANMFSIGVTWGFRTKEELIAAKANLVITSPTQFFELMPLELK